MKQCKQCRNGEHDNYDDDLLKVTYQDPDTKQTKTEIMCENHRIAITDDGYEILNERPV